MDEYKFSKYGNRMKMIREEHHIKQGQLADKIGISRQSMSNYESGKHSPDVDAVVKMANCYGCTTDYLLGLTEHSNDNKQAEFSAEFSALAEILCKLPEALRIPWIDSFTGMIQCIKTDLNNDTQFHYSVLKVFSDVMLLMDCCLTAKEKQSQGTYMEQDIRKDIRKRSFLMNQLTNDLNHLDNISYECIFETNDETLESNEISPALQKATERLATYFESKGEE